MKVVLLALSGDSVRDKLARLYPHASIEYRDGKVVPSKTPEAHLLQTLSDALGKHYPNGGPKVAVPPTATRP